MSVTKTVTTQAGLDAALADEGVTEVYIESAAGAWLEVGAAGGKYVRASGTATVRATGSATVTAYDSATVRASGSATVTAYDSATVTASGSATVTASGSATVTAYDSATVRAGKYTAVHLHSKRVRVEGGVVIDVTDIDKHAAASWCEWQGIPVEDGTAVAYKAVNDDLRSGQGFRYPIGETVVDPKWAPTDACGAGLHFGPSPSHAQAYHSGATRFLACRIRLGEAVGITGSAGDTAKIKAKSCDVLFEVDVHGRKIEAVA